MSDIVPVLVIIPTYNEALTLDAAVAGVRAALPHADVLVVDDASPDGTGRLAEQLSTADSAVHVLHRPTKQGLGAAYVDGFGWARRRGYAAVVEMDADGSHRPEQLPRLLSTLETADLVLGSRYVPGGSVQNWPRHRQLLSRGGNLYARVLLGIPLRDATGGFRAFRMTALDQLELHTVASAGYCFQVDLARRAVAAGMRVVEVPITFVEREQGTSKMTHEIVGEALVRITGWAIASRARQLRRLVTTWERKR